MVSTELVVLDMAGTTVADGGLVEEAFTAAISRQGVEPETPRYAAMLTHVRATMGESKIDVFRHLVGEHAETANLDFESAYQRLIDGARVRPIDGAVETIHELRGRGIKVALTTGFSPATRDALIEELGWAHLVDAVISPADAGRGRPYPDMVLTAVLRLKVDDVRHVAVVGDTRYDVLAGRRAGATVVAGVLTGAHDRDTLAAAGATHVLTDLTELPPLTQN